MLLSVNIHKSNIETEVEKVIPEAVSSALSEDLLKLVQVVTIFTKLVQEEKCWERDCSPTLGGGGEGGG